MQNASDNPNPTSAEREAEHIRQVNERKAAYVRLRQEFRARGMEPPENDMAFFVWMQRQQIKGVL